MEKSDSSPEVPLFRILVSKVKGGNSRHQRCNSLDITGSGNLKTNKN